MTKQGFRAFKYYKVNSTGLVSGLNVLNFMLGSGNPSHLVTEEMQAATSRLLPGLYASDVLGTRDASKAHAPLGRKEMA